MARMTIRSSSLCRVAWFAGLGLGAILLGGCSRELFTGDPYRSQYDRYDQSQAQLADDTVTDAYGNRRPNPRARLQPRD